MTEQQVWFLLIFSIPFIPAVVVFKLIKPRSGDAKIGGSIPIVKDLRIELGGAIATYVAIVLLALLSYSIITKDKRLVVQIVPENSVGQLATADTVNLDKLLSSSFELTILSEAGDRFLVPGSEFSFDENVFRFFAKPEVYVQSNGNTGKLHYEVGGNRFIKDTSKPKVLPVNKNGEYMINLQLEADLLADWIAHIDVFWVAIRHDEVSTTQLSVLQDNSREGISRVRFGTTNAPGLTRISTDVWDGSPEKIRQFLSSANEAANILESDTSTKIRKLGEALISDHDKLLIDSAIWESSDENGLQKATELNNPNVYFIHAPSKRIVLSDPKGGRYIVIRETTLSKIPFNAANSSHGVIYSHATKLTLLNFEIEEGLSTYFSVAPTIEGPGKDESIIPGSKFHMENTFLTIVETNLPKESAISVEL